ncbi:FAD-binding oxidoreductase [Haloferacaceae archaeon DSL9]
MEHDCAFLSELPLEGAASTGSSDRRGHASDWGTRGGGVDPDAVVFAASTADVSAVLAAANDRGVPVTPFAAGTGLEGSAVPVDGGISLDLTRLDSVHEIRPGDLQIDVGAGVIGEDVNEAVASHGLFFPPLPSSGAISTVGGMIATDASGMRTVKYGEVADWVCELEVVFADGSVATLGTEARKTSSGYNLKDLVVGSEGTLAVVTRATLELAGIPEQRRRGRAVFSTLDDATAAIADAVTAGVDFATVELLDETTIRLVNAYGDTGLPESPAVFVEFHANHGIDEEVDFCRTIFESHGLERFEIERDEAAMAALWRAREDISYAADEWDPTMRDVENGDVTVPIGAYGEMVRTVRDLADERDLLVPCFGHAGDGNLHYFAVIDPTDPDRRAAAAELNERAVEVAIDLGGTATGEHGIGIGKRKFMRREHGAVGVRMMRAVKDAFDPNGILNPGKVFPDDPPTPEP